MYLSTIRIYACLYVNFVGNLRAEQTNEEQSRQRLLFPLKWFRSCTEGLCHVTRNGSLILSSLLPPLPSPSQTELLFLPRKCSSHRSGTMYLTRLIILINYFVLLVILYLNNVYEIYENCFHRHYIRYNSYFRSWAETSLVTPLKRYYFMSVCLAVSV